MEAKNSKVERRRRKSNGFRLPPIANDSDKVKTVLDIDPHYFSLVEGRPIRPNSSINTYKKNIKEVALKRTVHGFRSDEILRIDEEIMSERKTFESATKLFDECKKSFDKFLAYDNDKTISVMKKSDALNKALMIMTEDHKSINYEMASLKSKLQYIDETLSILLSFENFLQKIAPHLWQKSENIDLTKEHTEIFNMDLDIFQKINSDVIKDKINNLVKPKLYFESPEQLLDIFQLLEKQNLNYLLITEEMSALKNNFLKARGIFRRNLKAELNFIQDKTIEIEDIIQWHTMKENEIKEVFFKILEEKIRYLVSSEMALQIYTYVEYAYEQVVAPNDTKQSTLHMTLALESEYNNLMLELSAFDPSVIRDIETTTFEKAAKGIRDAKYANTMLKNIDKVSKRLATAYQPAK